MVTSHKILEKEIGNRESKSVVLYKAAVKEQRI